MKHIFSLCLAACFLVACAGNPPAWWNPDNRYGVAGSQPAQKVVPNRKIVQEEKIDTFEVSSYEEEVIAPLPEEEEPSARGGELPAPSILE